MQLMAVIVVCSAVENVARRDAIRSSWGSPRTASGLGLRVVYVLGRVEGDGDVAAEARRHGDVVQADIVDSYSNLGVKSLAALRWVAERASCARFVVKTDDDTFVNAPLLSRDLAATAHLRFVMGHVIARAHPVRGPPSAKWYTPRSVYRGEVYPTYVSGAAYVISADAVRPLLVAAAASPVFWIEDVYVTGMLAGAAGVQLIVNGKLDGYRAMSDDCAVRSHIAIHRVSAHDMHKLWTIVTANLHCH